MSVSRFEIQRRQYDMSNLLAAALDEAGKDDDDDAVVATILQFMTDAYADDTMRATINNAIDHTSPKTWSPVVLGLYLQTKFVPNAFVAAMIAGNVQLSLIYRHFAGIKGSKGLHEIIKNTLNDKQKQCVCDEVLALGASAGLAAEAGAAAAASSSSAAAAAVAKPKAPAKPRSKQTIKPPTGPLLTPESVKQPVTVALLTNKHGLFRKDDEGKVLCVRSNEYANKVASCRPIFETYGLLVKMQSKYVPTKLEEVDGAKCLVCQAAPFEVEMELVEGYPKAGACQACLDAFPDVKKQFDYSFQNMGSGSAKKRPAAEEGDDSAAADDDATPRVKRVAVAAPGTPTAVAASSSSAAAAAKPPASPSRKPAAAASSSSAAPVAAAPSSSAAVAKVFAPKQTTPQRPSAVAAKVGGPVSNLAAKPPASPSRKPAPAPAPVPADDDDDVQDMV